MAKNYTIKEAVEIIVEGKDLESITDLGRRYPVLTAKVAAIGAIAGDKFVDFMGYMPDYLTANKVNTAIKAGITESGSDENAEDTEAEATTEDAGEDATEATVQWDESMSAKQLWDILGKAGKRKLAKSTKKADLIEACKQAFGVATEAEDEDDEEEDNTTEANPYEGKSAMELFKECKARKIKAAPKKPAKFYADLLIKDDAAKAEATEAESEEDDDWGDEEDVEEEAPKKATNKGAKKASAKSTKKAPAKKAEPAEEEDDGDDWDI